MGPDRIPEVTVTAGHEPVTADREDPSNRGVSDAVVAGRDADHRALDVGYLLNPLSGAPMAKILLVEDNEMNRDMLSRRLVRKGYEVVCAEDGSEGVSMAATESPDLVLMDMSLPVLDGWEATRKLKSAVETNTLPVIALTAHAMEGDEEKARDAGCDDYDTKPVDLPRLLGKIEALLGS